MYGRIGYHIQMWRTGCEYSLTLRQVKKQRARGDLAAFYKSRFGRYYVLLRMNWRV